MVSKKHAGKVKGRGSFAFSLSAYVAAYRRCDAPPVNVSDEGRGRGKAEDFFGKFQKKAVSKFSEIPDGEGGGKASSKQSPGIPKMDVVKQHERLRNEDG